MKIHARGQQGDIYTPIRRLRETSLTSPWRHFLSWLSVALKEPGVPVMRSAWKLASSPERTFSQWQDSHGTYEFDWIWANNMPEKWFQALKEEELWPFLLFYRLLNFGGKFDHLEAYEQLRKKVRAQREDEIRTKWAARRLERNTKSVTSQRRIRL